VKILVLATEYPPAKGFGIGRYISEHSAALSRLGHDVHVVTNNVRQGRDTWTDKGVRVYGASGHLDTKPYSRTSAVLQANQELLGRGLSVVAEHGPFDVLLVHDWLGALAGKALREAHCVPTVLTMHETEVGRTFGQPNAEQQYVAEVEKWACAVFESVVCCSEFIKDELIRFCDVPASKITVIPCGVSEATMGTDARIDLFRSMFAEEDEKLAVFVGRLTTAKGPTVLLEAIPKVLAVYPKIKFAIAGNGDQMEAVQSRVAELGLGERVILTDYIAGKVLATLYHAADMLVVPSLYEPFGMVALEGMVTGTPVIVSDTGGLAETVDHDVTGLRVTPNDPNALAAAIVRLCYSPDLALQLAENGYRCAVERYPWTRVASETEAAYQRVVRAHEAEQ